MEKFFPNNLDDNIRQLHGLKEFDLTKWYADKQKEKKYESIIVKAQKQAFEKQNKFTYTLFPFNLA